MTSYLRKCILGGLFVSPFLVFVVMNSLFFPFITGKGFAFRILVEILAVAWIVLALAQPVYRPRRSWIFYGSIIFVAIVTLADLFGVNVSRSVWSNFERMEGLITILHVFMYMIILGTMLNTEKLWNYFFNTTLGASVLMCLFKGLPQLYGAATIHQSSDRLDATFGNATYFAVYLMMHMFIALFLMFRTHVTLLKWVYAMIVVLEGFLLFHTQTRGAMLGLVGGLFVATALTVVFERERKTVRRISAGILIALTVFVGLFFAFRDTAYMHQHPTLKRFAEISFTESFLKGQGRYYVWPMAIKGFAERPLLGWGQENFNYVFNKNYDPNMWSQEQWFDRTHNVVLDWLVAGGILGLGSYLFIFVALFYYIWRGRGGVFTVSDKSILTGMLLAYFFQNLFVFDNLVSYMLFMMLIAYVYAVRTPLDSRPILNRVVSEQTAIGIVLPALIIVLCVGGFVVNIKPLWANRALLESVAPEPDGSSNLANDLASFKRAIAYNTFATTEAREHLGLFAQRVSMDQNVPNDVRQSVYNYATEQLEQQIMETKTPDARHELFVGALHSRYGIFDKAKEHLERALELSPNKQSIMYEYGMMYLAQGNTQAALDVFKQAFELDTANTVAASQYLIVSLEVGDIKKANELLPLLDPETRIHDDRIVTAYLRAKEYPTMIAILTEKLATNPTSPQFILSLAAGYLTAGDRTMAIKTLETFIALDPAKYKKQGDYYISEIRAGRNPTQ